MGWISEVVCIFYQYFSNLGSAYFLNLFWEAIAGPIFSQYVVEGRHRVLKTLVGALVPMLNVYRAV